MEQSIHLLRKVNTYLQAPTNTDDLWRQFNYSPQHALFQVSQTDSPAPLQMRPVNVDPWLTPDSSYKLNDTIKPLQRLRKTVHIKPSQNRSWKPTEFEGTSEKKIRKSIIPKLKNLLQKLESPEKNNQTSDKKLQNNFVEETTQTPKLFIQRHKSKQQNVSIRITNHSSEKKSRLGICSFKEGRTQIFHTASKPSKPYSLNFQAHLNSIRQARRKRNLKNILF